MLTLWPFHHLTFQHGKTTDELTAGLLWQNNLVDKAALCGPVGVGELLGIIRLFLCQLSGGVFSRLDLSSENDLGSTLCTHHGNLRRWPSEVEIGTDVLGVHNVVRPAVGLAGDDGDAGNGCFAQGV